MSRPELGDQFVVVDRQLLAIGRRRSLDVPRRDDLLVRLGRIGGLDLCDTRGGLGHIAT